MRGIYANWTLPVLIITTERDYIQRSLREEELLFKLHLACDIVGQFLSLGHTKSPRRYSSFYTCNISALFLFAFIIRLKKYNFKNPYLLSLEMLRKKILKNFLIKSNKGKIYSAIYYKVVSFFS
jgi:hypothetical protein